jgi:hypothetical protein
LTKEHEERRAQKACGAEEDEVGFCHCVIGGGRLEGNDA